MTFSISYKSKFLSIISILINLPSYSFELSLEDPNYGQYINGIMDLEEGAPVLYYLHQARRMKELEKLTMYIDFNHLAGFPH
jgi:hypothetical protein